MEMTGICRRLLSTVLATVLILAALPLTARADQAQPVGISKETMIAAIEPQIRAFAKSIDQKNADTEAAADLATHGLTGRGKTLKMDKNDAMTAALMNSELVQEGFSVGMANVFWNMQRMSLDSVAGARLQFVWSGAGDQYFATILKAWGPQVENHDWMVTRDFRSGNRNGYDSSLEWMAGTVYADVQIQCIKEDAASKTYKLTVIFMDKFDFSTATTSGFKKLMSGLGMLLFKEFEWNCTFSLDVTVPYSYDHCSHGLFAYRWVYDKEKMELISDDSEPFRQNNATLRNVTNNNGTESHYFELDQTVLLRHDETWVVEYDAVNPRLLALTPVENTVSKNYPQIWQNGGAFVYVSAKLDRAEQDPYDKIDSQYVYSCVGTTLKDLFSYDSKKLYTYRLENVPEENGNNRIYLTVTDTETGIPEINRVLMDDYYRCHGWRASGELISTESELLAGKDILINFIGSSLDSLNVDSLELRIWERGQDNPDTDFWIEDKVEASCTEDGYTVRTCSRCGFSVQTEKAEALGHEWTPADCLNPKCCNRCGETEGQAAGHTFSQWEVSVPAACGKDGVQIRSCHCGAEETQPLPGLEHEYHKGSCGLCGMLDPEFLLGDVNFDGKLSYSDALSVLRYSIQLETLENPALADLNSDGEVNYEDALAILRASIGL